MTAPAIPIRHDFYSDTQTRPTRAMREAALEAELGDERHDACPTTLALCERVADELGMEAAVFLPSGTMCNEIAIAVHCRPGDEVICERRAHVIYAESGGPAALSGVMMAPIDGERGQFDAARVRAAIRPPSSFAPRSRLLITEQTSNLGGGSVWPRERLSEVALAAREQGLAVHLDGARLHNAVVASGVDARTFCAHHDSAWVAFTKGLGCPIGAVLAGSREFVEQAWLFKRRWGGAMRQTGVITAMCLHALDHHVERLAEDHALARLIGERLAALPLVARVLPVETNIVIAELVSDGPTARAVLAHLRTRGVQLTVTGTHQVRIVTHMDVGEDDAVALLAALGELSPR